MKKYILFAMSFTVSFIILQMLSGVILISFYTPDISSAWLSASNSASFGEIARPSSVMPLAIGLLSIGIALGVTRLFKNSTFSHR